MISIPAYPYRWPFVVLLVCYTTAATYKLVGDGENEALKRRQFLAKGTAGSLKQLQAVLLSCSDRESLDAIQRGILSVIVDKTKELLSEHRNVVSANLMIADDAAQQLRLTIFSQQAVGREKRAVPYGAPGAGRALLDGKVVYIPDIRSSDMKGHFRNDAPYRSILCLPITCEHKKLGVVNVDSTEVDYFRMTWLADHLAPYTELLGLSLCLKAQPQEGR